MSSSSNIASFACRPPLGDNVRLPAVRLQRYSEIHPTAGIAVSNMRCRASVDVLLQKHYTVRLPAAPRRHCSPAGAVRLQHYSEIHPTAGRAVLNLRCRASVDALLQKH